MTKDPFDEALENLPKMTAPRPVLLPNLTEAEVGKWWIQKRLDNDTKLSRILRGARKH